MGRIILATPSNCGETLRASSTKTMYSSWPTDSKKGPLGYGKNGEDVTMGNPQPNTKLTEDDHRHVNDDDDDDD